MKNLLPSQTDEHAVLAPSKAHRWMCCPGSVALTRGITEKTNAFAEAGTLAHEHAKRFLNNRLLKKKLSLRGLETMEPDFAETVDMYVDHIEKLVMKSYRLIDFLVEGKLHAPDVSPDMWGTADFVLRTQTRLTVVDLKTGVIPVEVTNNVQLLIYAGLVIHMLRWKPRWIEIQIVQPRAHHRDGPIRTQVLKSSEFNRWWSRIIVQAELASSSLGERTFAAGDHCQWCPAAGSCWARIQQTKLEFGDDFPVEKLATKGLVLSPRQLSDDEIGKVLERIRLVESIAGDVKKEAYARAINGQQIYGHKLVRKSGRRRYRDEKGAMEALAKLFPAQMFSEVRLFPLTTLEKTAELGRLIAPFIEKPEGGIELVPGSAAGEPIDPSAELLEQFAK